MPKHNAGTAKNIIYVERQLRAGKTPEQLGGEKIGEGVCKAAYRIGNYVVKLNAQGGYAAKQERLPPKDIRKYAVRTYVAGDYLIQEYATPWRYCTEEQKRPLRADRAFLNSKYDCHDGNIGITASGRLVAFDW